MSRIELFHVGIVVPDLEAARARFTELLGLEWGPRYDGEVEVRDGAGNDLVITNRAYYSTGAPYLELIEGRAGSPWECNDFSNLHHLGFFVDDLGAESAALSSLQCPLQLSGRDGATAPLLFTYHGDALGVRLEYVDAALRPLIAELTGGPTATA